MKPAFEKIGLVLPHRVGVPAAFQEPATPIPIRALAGHHCMGNFLVRELLVLAIVAQQQDIRSNGHAPCR